MARADRREPLRALAEHWRFLTFAVVAIVVAGGALALLTDTPAEIRLRDQLGLDHPCLPETVDSEGWREEAPLPGKTDEGRAVELDGKIYLSGGTARLVEYGNPSSIPGVREEVRAESMDRMLRFDPQTGAYDRMAPMPERLNHHVMAVHDGKIYVVGGSGDLLFGADPRDALFEYDPATDRWRELEPKDNAPPFRDAEFDIMFDRGISYEGDLIDLAVTTNVVEKSGAWYNYKTTRLGQGRENSKQFLADNKDLAEEIRLAVLASKGLGSAGSGKAPTENAEVGA